MGSVESPLILSIDCGTQSMRAILFDLEGRVAAASKLPIQPYFSKQPLWAEQDPEYYWQMLCRCCQELWKKPGADRRRIEAAALTTQRNTVVSLDANGQPLRPAIMWLDKRKTAGLPPLKGLWGIAFKLAGLSKVAKNFKADSKANWIYQNQPDIWKATRKFLLLSGYLNYRLCGEYADSAASQVGYLPFDYKTHRWASKSNWKWQMQPITLKMLPDLVPCGHLLGHLKNDAARQIGIKAGIPLFAAAGDKACDVLGTGCLEPWEGSINYGTSATFTVCGQSYHELYGYLPPYPAAIPGRYTNEYQINRGYWLVNWFKEQFAASEVEKAHTQNLPVEILFDDLMKGIPAGNLGLMLQPYWSPGLNIKQEHAKGCMIGFGDVHHRGHVYKAIIEGIAYELRRGKEIIEKKTKTPVAKIRVSGGGSQSDEVMQVTADMFGMPASRIHTSETAGLGAAIDAAVGLGAYSNFYSAVEGMVRKGKTFTPRPEAADVYEQLYTRVYSKLFDCLCPLYEEIQKITNYAETY